MLTRLVATILLCCASFCAHATKPAPPRMVTTLPGAEPIQMQQLSIRAEISGGMAETTVRMVFFNPGNRQLEGTVDFPLADGQQITAFALDINGVLRPAVPVDKAKGRQVFEAIERRKVDPGLLEATQGNNFKLRVYPILPRATRTVEITYTEALARRAGNWAYQLPLAYGSVQNFDLALTVNDSVNAPIVDGLGPELRFERNKNAWVARMARQRHVASGALELLIGAATAPRVYTQRFGEASYFVAELPVQSIRTPRAAPRVVGLLWDSSGSGANRALAAEIAELDRYFTALGDVQVRLTRLRDRAEATQTFQVVRGDWSALRQSLQSTVYDGASALNDWTVQRDVDQYLLFSDGLSNYGGARFPALDSHQSLFALNSALSADSARLAGLAERHHGQLIQVSASAPGAAANALLFEEARITGMSASGATDLETDSHSAHEGMLRVAGRLLAPEAELAITLVNGGMQERIALRVERDEASHPFAAHTWAAFRLRALEAEFDANRSEIARIGRHFGIPTRETSLIVLETLDDYLRHEIEPPGALSGQFRQRMDSRQQQLAGERSKHIDNVVRMYRERIQWWNRSFVRKAPAVATGEQEKRSRADEPPVLSVVPARPAALPEMKVFAPPVQMAMPAPAAEMMAPPKMAERGGVAKPSAEIGIALRKWVPNAPYIRRLRAAPAGTVYQVYLDQKPDYANSTAFFLDVADILVARGQRDLALRVLSNLAEMELENRAVLRILGYRLLQAGAPALAVPVFEQVLRIAEEEPQSFRDLGLALAAAGRLQEAVDTMAEVIVRPWDERFPDIEVVTVAEINAIAARSRKRLDLGRIDRRLRANLPLDLRVVMTWDADNSDMDLHVTDPNQEESFFGNPLTAQGGHMSRDFTGGYGPEEFALRKAIPGKYRIEANFYGNQQQVLAGATTVQVKLFSHFGTARQKEQLITLRLKEQSSRVFVGEFEVKP